MADPAFLHKMAMEQAITIGSSLWWEAQQRGDRFSKASPPTSAEQQRHCLLMLPAASLRLKR